MPGVCNSAAQGAELVPTVTPTIGSSLYKTLISSTTGLFPIYLQSMPHTPKAPLSKSFTQDLQADYGGK